MFSIRTSKVLKAAFAAVILLLLSLVTCDQEVWEKDVSDDVYIEASREGFKGVRLTCDGESMRVKVDLEEDFDGVFYTRGAYSEAKAPCYLDAQGGTTSAELVIPLDGCKNRASDDGRTRSNVVIVQYDDWLIFPGDNAFEITCSRSEDGEWTASVGLADPDPSAKELPKHRKSTVSADRTVEFRPDDIRPIKKKSKKGKKKKKDKKSKDEL